MSNTLLFGLETIVHFITPDLLRSYRLVCDKYFSFLCYLFASQEKALSDKLTHTAAVNPSSRLLANIVEHLLWGAGAVDSASARQALQGLNLLATQHAKSIASGGVGFGAAVIAHSLDGSVEPQSLFSYALQRLFEMIIFPSSSDYGIATDRIDACASAFCTLIAMDVHRFNSCAQQLISQQPDQVKLAIHKRNLRFIYVIATKMTCNSCIILHRFMGIASRTHEHVSAESYLR